MGLQGRTLTAALVALGASIQGAAGTEAKTWYVYCEGASAEGHWAVFSENFWPHADSVDYGRRVGSAAKTFFEARHDVALEGCAGVNFRDDSLAEHSRKLTVQLHRRMGDRVYFFPLPSDVLPDDAPPQPAVTVTASVDERDAAPAEAERQWRPYGAPR